MEYFGYNSLQPSFNYMHNQVFDLGLPPIEEDKDIYLKSDDDLFVETWLSKIGKINLQLDSTSIVENKSQIKSKKVTVSKYKLADIKNMINKWIKLNKRLEELKYLMQENIAGDSTNWDSFKTEIELTKININSIRSKFRESDLILMKQCVAKRVKKRKRLKNKRNSLKLFKKEEKEKRQIINKQIDDWLQSMKESVEQAKVEEQMRKHADEVLSEVTKKKSDVRKQLNIIKSLVNLRQLRSNVAAQRGDKLNKEDEIAFKKTTDSLVRMWENALATYTKEELELKAMLDKNADKEKLESSNAEMVKNEKICQMWQEMFFGMVKPEVMDGNYWSLMIAEKNFDAFIAIRRGWDQYINPNGTKIPIGWVTPNINPNDEWSKYRLN